MPRSSNSLSRAHLSRSSRPTPENLSRKRIKIGARASIACEMCRRRKVRCSGDWPTCIFCSRRKLDCVYDGHPAEHAADDRDTEESPQAGSKSSVDEPSDIPLPPTEIMIRGFEKFISHFSDPGLFNFIHAPTFTAQLKQSTALKELCFAILTLSARFVSELVEKHGSPIQASAYYELAVLHSVQAHPDVVSLERAQTLLLLSLQECTHGKELQGWVHLGQAIRLSHLLRLSAEDDPLDPSDPSNVDTRSGSSTSRGPSVRSPVESEARRRTFWSLFLAERLLTTGRDRPCTLQPPTSTTTSFPSASIQFPSSDSDFLSGVKNPRTARFEGPVDPWSKPYRVEQTSGLVSHPFKENEADLLGQTLRISEIWARIIAYVTTGGRNVDRRPPWHPASTFSRLERQLKAWSDGLSPHFHYSESNLLAHSFGSQGRLFGLCHLLHYMSVLYLHRDYIPFMPPPQWHPKNGPIDGEPLFLDGAQETPPGWWNSSAETAYRAANSITDLVVDLDRHDSTVLHPFTGFATLTAGTMHAHLFFWPFDGSQYAVHYLLKEIMILEYTQKIWAVARQWNVSLNLLFEAYGAASEGQKQETDSQPYLARIRSAVMELLPRPRTEPMNNAVSNYNGRGNEDDDYKENSNLQSPIASGQSQESLLGKGRPRKYNLRAILNDSISSASEIFGSNSISGNASMKNLHDHEDNFHSTNAGINGLISLQNNSSQRNGLSLYNEFNNESSVNASHDNSSNTIFYSSQLPNNNQSNVDSNVGIFSSNPQSGFDPNLFSDISTSLNDYDSMVSPENFLDILGTGQDRWSALSILSMDDNNAWWMGPT